jgi:DNA-binding MarR family transcriptional regulator
MNSASRIPQYIVLVALWDEEGQTIGSIADRLGLESSTVTPLVKRLEVAGLVSRKANRSDERPVFVTVTERGRTMQAESDCLGLRLLEQSGMQPSELMALIGEVK